MSEFLGLTNDTGIVGRPKIKEFVLLLRIWSRFFSKSLLKLPVSSVEMQNLLTLLAHVITRMS